MENSILFFILFLRPSLRKASLQKKYLSHKGGGAENMYESRLGVTIIIIEHF